MPFKAQSFSPLPRHRKDKEGTVASGEENEGGASEVREANSSCGFTLIIFKRSM